MHYKLIHFTQTRQTPLLRISLENPVRCDLFLLPMNEVITLYERS
jgi:hypothetical protein